MKARRYYFRAFLLFNLVATKDQKGPSSQADPIAIGLR